MASSDAHQEPHIDHGEASSRSRASSVFSTGTKFSIATLPQVELYNSGPAFSEQPEGSAARPHSLRTLASHEEPAPPYESHQSTELSQSSPVQRRLAALEQPSSLVAATFETPSASPSSEPENTLSMHYQRVVQTIDQNHARELQNHALELANLAKENERRLHAARHEIDQAYRREWKAKNREIEKLREEANAQIAALELECQNREIAHAAAIAQSQQDATNQVTALVEEHELTTEKARNAIEDLWERRWSDRVRLASEEARRLTLEGQKAVADRDAEWIRALEVLHPELLDELRGTVKGLKADS